MKSWLLTWNPACWDVSRLVRACAERGSVRAAWTTQARRIGLGDRVVMLRQGSEPRGIVGVGMCDGEVYAHGRRHYVPATWHHFEATPPLVTLPELERRFPTAHWRTRCSGIRIPEPVDAMLEVLLEERLAAPCGEMTHEDILSIRADVLGLASRT